MNESTSRVTSSSLVILGPRVGRPRVAYQRTSVSAWIPAKDYDKLAKLAAQHGKSVSALVRDFIRKQVG